MVSSEKWFEPLTKVVNDLKLKASYGKVGNDDIGASRRWAYEPSVNTVTGWSYGKTANQTGTGYRVGEIENTNVSWEEATKVNAGIELRLFEKLKIQADYFYEERNGIFLARAGLPAIVGLTTTPYVNVGKAKVSGLDGTLEYQQQVGKVLLTGRGNFTFRVTRCWIMMNQIGNINIKILLANRLAVMVQRNVRDLLLWDFLKVRQK